MSQDTEAALPPYFNISPDTALAELGTGVGTGSTPLAVWDMHSVRSW